MNEVPLRTRSELELVHLPAEIESVRRSQRRRRPSGSPPPLPRKLGVGGRVWLGLILAVAIVGTLTLTSAPVLHLADRIDGAILRAVARSRTGWLTDAMRAIKAAASGWFVVGLAWAMVAAMMIFRRGRHLLVFLISLFVLEEIAALLYKAVDRPRPYDVTIISGWGGFSMPSP